MDAIYECECYRGAVAQDGRIEPGDMILEVNGVSFENMSNDDAVKTLRESVQKPGYGVFSILIMINITTKENLAVTKNYLNINNPVDYQIKFLMNFQ